MINPQVKAYGASSALTAEATQVAPNERDQGRLPPFHTLSIDIALKNRSSYDWDNKITLRLTDTELPKFACVLLGWLPSTSGQHHGPRKDKGFEITHQGKTIYLKLFQREAGVRPVPLSPPDVMALTSLTLRQLQLNNPWLTPDTVLALLKNTITRMELAN